ncbi:MAG: dockerin type I domain-containing protein [Bacteroidaceae bacterium]|nr:dockerin type I domain-containing protein [Paraprevotella sp.]MDY5328565.1 dockerin type I domain-containing protein [Bacteroidaceae bacterium]
MNKKVLVSILAMTSASTMTAWADANVDKLKTDNLEDWKKGSEGSDLELKGGVIVSPDGADIVKTINLAPGTYRLAGTLTNAKILFGTTELIKVEGKDYYTFKVTGDAPTDSTLTFKAVNQGQQSSIGGLTLTLMYDFDADRKVLERQLTDLINTLKEGDKQYETLTQKSSEIAKEIARLENDKEGAYEAYVEFKMYLGVANCTLQEVLAKFKNDVNHQANNKKAYDAAISLINAQNDRLNEAKSTLDGYSNENKLSDYAKGITSDRLNAAETAIKAAQTQAETAHEGNSAANDLGEEWTKNFTQTVPTLVTAFADAVNAAPADHEAYRTIGNRIADLKTLQENAVQEILKELTDKDADGNEVYTDSRDEAQKQLGDVLVKITSIENQKGSDTNHEGASALYSGENKDNLKEGGTFEVQITEIREEWKAFAQKHKGAYKNAKESVNKLQSDLEQIKKDLAFTKKYEDRIQKVQELIDAHSKTIEADNKEHTIGDKVDNYNYDDVTNAIKLLKGDSDHDIKNNKLYLAAIESVKVAQSKLDAAKEEVSKLTSEEDGYSTSGKYTTTETELQNKLNKISETIEAHNIKLEVESDYTTDFLKEVSSYQTAAEKAKENYMEITKTLKEYNASLETLKGTALDTNVTIGDGEETYGDRIDAINGIIKGIQDSFKAAKEKTDDEYNKGLSDTREMLKDGKDIADEVASLCASYPGDKAKYDDDIVSKAIVRVLAEATNLVNTQKEELEEIGSKFAGLNENLDSVKNAKVEYNRLKQVIVEQEDAIKEANDATTNTNKAEVLATLQAVQSTLEQNAGEIKKLSGKINECWKHKNANDGKWNNLIKAEDGRLTKLSKAIDSILTEYKDPDRVKEFTDLHNGLSTEYTDLHSEIEASYKAETLIENWEDKTVEEKEIKGFDSQISDLETRVGKAVDDAKASAANRQAYDDTKKYSDDKDIAGKIEEACKNLDGEWAQYVDEDAWKHYDSVLTGYKEINSKINDDIEKAYKDRQSDSLQVDLKGRIDDLLEKVNAVGPEIQNNKGSYESLCTTYGTVSAAWTSVYATISETDNSSERENYLKELRDLKAQLVDAKSAIDQNYKDGVYGSGNQASIDEGKLRSLEEKINNLKNTQSAGYIALIEQDNANRHKDFNTTLTAARNEWSAAVDTVGMYSNLTNENLRLVVTRETQEANSKLTEILTQMNRTATSESEDYQKTVAPTLFDKDEVYKKAIEAERAKIQQTLDNLDNKVSSEAKTLFKDKWKSANDRLTSTRLEIEGITLNDNDIKKAIIEASSDYKVAEGIVEDAKKAFESNDFALVVDEHLTALGTVEGLLASAKEQAAVWEWERFVKDVAETKANQESDLDKYTYLAGNVRNFKDEYDGVWSGETEGSDRLEEFKKRASEYKQANSLFANVGDLKYDLQLDVVEVATGIYEDAQTAAGLYTVNLEAYNVLIAQANGLQDSLNKAKTYVDAFGCSYLLPTLVSNVQKTLDDVFAKLDYQSQYGGCTGDEYKIEKDGKTTYDVDKKKTIEVSINKLYSLSYQQELAWLQSQVSDLDGEYNKAYAKNDTEAEKFKGDKDELQKEVNGYSFDEESENETQDGLQLKSNETIQSDLLKFESEIATLRSQLLKISAPDTEAAIIESLNGQLDDVRTSYEEKQGLLEEKGLTNKEGDLEERGFTEEEINAIKDLDVVGNTIAEIQNKIDACEAEDGKILLNQTAIEQAIGKVKSEMEGLTGKIDELVAKYDANEAAYAKLSAQIAADNAELDAAKAAIDKLTTIDEDKADSKITEIKTEIDSVKSDLDESYGETGLAAESTVKEFRDKIATILNDIATLLKDYTYEENSNLIKNLQIAINGTKAELINSSNVMNKEDLLIKIDSLATSAQNLSNYNVDAKDGEVSCDIDGNETKETKVDYVKEVSPAIGEKLNELNETLAALVDTKDENTYVVGDADGDGNVQVTDYMTVMKLVLGTESVEEGTVNFLRADANQDGKINNGDLVAVVNKILGIRTVDALEQVLATNSMESVGEVKMAAVEGVASKKIAIQLSSTNKYAACQMDVNIPAGVTVTSSSIEGLQNHSLYSAEQTDGTLRLVVSSLENAVMDTEGNATIYLEVEGNNAEAITVSNVTAADVAGATYNIVDKGEATGINGVVSNANSGSLKQRIYSVGGQMMDGVKKGINIIMNSDGTARKVLKK